MGLITNRKIIEDMVSPWNMPLSIGRKGVVGCGLPHTPGVVTILHIVDNGLGNFDKVEHIGNQIVRD